MTTINPFILRNYLGAEYFCNRQKELKSLTEKFDNQRFTTLISQRRMGKTGLIYRFFDHIRDHNPDVKCLYIDLLDTQNMDDFIKKLTEEIALKVYSSSNKILKNFKNIFHSINPLITFDSNNGIPQVEFGFKNAAERQNSLNDLLQFLRNYENPILIVFDEFQQIANYPDLNMEAVLRTHIQNIQNINFIFSGSDKHLLTEMFLSSKRPFFQSTDTMYLNPIPVDEYTKFIIEKMALGKKTISQAALDYIFEFTKVHTFYVQNMCNRLFISNSKNIDLKDAKEIGQIILDENENSYYGYRRLIPEIQWKLLEGIAKEQGAEKIFSSYFIQTYKLNTQGSTQKALQGLIDKEMIYEDDKKYYVQDVFLSRWLEKRRF